MKKLLVVFLFLVSAAGVLPASDLYWISFNHHGTDNCYLMQIDALGNVTVAPKVVFLDFHSHSTAVANVSATQLVYYANSASSDGIRRVLINKSTFAMSGDKILTQVVNDSGGLQVTQGASTFFMAFETGDATLKGFGLTSTGKLSGSNWRLSPRTDGGNDEGGVSADGRMAFSSNYDSPDYKLYLQPLKGSGLPTGLPSVVASGSLDSGDVSNVLPGNIRFAVYTDESMDEVFVQRVDATTGAKLGGPKVIGHSDPDHSSQMTAIDPLGRFVIYSDNAEPCAVSSMYYQALDATGSASGARKELVGCAFQNELGDIHGIRGYDLLKN